MRWWMTPVMCLVACGPSVDDDPQAGTGGVSSSGSTTGSMTSGSSSDWTSATTTATATATTLASATSATDPSTDTSASTTDADTETVSTSDETGDDSTGAAVCGQDAEYRAAELIGALDRVQIFRTNPISGECVLLTIASPMEFSEYDVETTRPWALERALVSADPSDCDNPVSTAGFSSIPDAEGTIEVSLDTDGRPCALAVDVTLQLLKKPAPPVYVEFCHPEISVGDCML